MKQVNIYGVGHLFNHCDFEKFKTHLKSKGINLKNEVHKFINDETYEFPDPPDVILFTCFDIHYFGNPMLLHDRITELKKRYPTCIIVGFLQEIPHYKIDIRNFSDWSVDKFFGIAPKSRMMDYGLMYDYLPFPTPDPRFSTSFNYLLGIKKQPYVLLTGAFRLSRAQLYYRLLKEFPTKVKFFICSSREHSKAWLGGNYLFPINFQKEFPKQVIVSNENRCKQFNEEILKSAAVLNFSRQLNSRNAFHTDIDVQFGEMVKNEDYEFIPTRFGECAAIHTTIITNFDRLHKESGLLTMTHILSYSTYEQLKERINYVCSNVDIATNMGHDLNSLLCGNTEEWCLDQILTHI